MKKSKRLYCLTSSFFSTKEKALKQIQEWQKSGTLKDDCRIVKVSEVFRVMEIPSYSIVLEKDE